MLSFNFFAFLQIFLLSWRYFYAYLQIFLLFTLNICTFLQCFCFPATKFTFLEVLLLPFTYVCFLTNSFAFLHIFEFLLSCNEIYFPLIFFAFLHTFLFPYKYFCFSSNILTFLQILSFSFKHLCFMIDLFYFNTKF